MAGGPRRAPAENPTASAPMNAGADADQATRTVQGTGNPQRVTAGHHRRGRANRSTHKTRSTTATPRTRPLDRGRGTNRSYNQTGDPDEYARISTGGEAAAPRKVAAEAPSQHPYRPAIPERHKLLAVTGPRGCRGAG